MARDSNEAINSYIGDMLALEDHIEKAIRGQLTDLKAYPEVVSQLQQIHRKIERHISDLRMLSDRRNAGGVAQSVKRAGSAFAGVAAGVIDLVRSEGLPKNLRDDYTAFNLANIGYAMLYTTALSLGDQEVGELAQQHYRDYTDAVMRFNSLVPAAVVRYLQEEGLPAREDVLPEVNRNIDEAWHQSAVSPANETVSAREL